MQYASHQRARVRGLLAALILPTSLGPLIKKQGYSAADFLDIAHSLTREGSVAGMIQGDTYVPTIYATARDDYLEASFAANSALDLALLTQVHLDDPRGYLKRKFENRGVLLGNVFTGHHLIELLDDQIIEACESASWTAIPDLIPAVLSSASLDQLLPRCQQLQKLLKSGTYLLLEDTFLVSAALLQTFGLEYRKLVTEKFAQGELLVNKAPAEPAGAGKRRRAGRTKAKATKTEAYRGTEVIVAGLGPEAPEELVGLVESRLQPTFQETFNEVQQSLFVSKPPVETPSGNSKFQENFNQLLWNIRLWEQASASVRNGETRGLLVKHLMRNCQELLGLTAAEMARHSLISLDATKPFPSRIQALPPVIREKLSLCWNETVTADLLAFFAALEACAEVGDFMVPSLDKKTAARMLEVHQSQLLAQVAAETNLAYLFQELVILLWLLTRGHIIQPSGRTLGPLLDELYRPHAPFHQLNPEAVKLLKVAHTAVVSMLTSPDALPPPALQTSLGALRALVLDCRALAEPPTDRPVETTSPYRSVVLRSSSTSWVGLEANWNSRDSGVARVFDQEGKELRKKLQLHQRLRQAAPAVPVVEINNFYAFLGPFEKGLGTLRFAFVIVVRNFVDLEFRFTETGTFRDFPPDLPVQAPILADSRSVVYAGTFHVRKKGSARLLVLDNSNRAYAASATLLPTVQALLERELGVQTAAFDCESAACQLYSQLLAEGQPVPFDFQREEPSGDGLLAYRLLPDRVEFLVGREGRPQWTAEVAEDGLAGFLASLPVAEQKRILDGTASG